MNPYDRPINLVELAALAWRRKWWIVVPTVVASALAVAYAFAVTSRYRAETVVIQRELKGMSGLSGQIARIGGLADLAGLNLGDSSKQEPMGVLRSRGFARRFIERNQLATVLAQPGGDEPEDIRATVDRFKRKVLSVSEDKKAGLVTVAVEWKDPELAAQWANGIIDQVNSELRDKALVEAKRNIDFLRGALAETELVALQQPISRLLESEMQNAMLAQGNRDYAFRVVDEAQPPFKRSFPRRTMIVLLAFLVSLAASMTGVVVAERWRQRGAARR